MAKKGNNNNSTQVIRVSDKTREKLIKFYEDKKRDKVIPYVVFQAQDGDTVITLYESGKVMFQGVSADIDANMWRDIDGQEKVDKVKLKEDEKKYYYSSSIGSDEVGTGDYFGPIVVTSAYVSKDDIVNGIKCFGIYLSEQEISTLVSRLNRSGNLYSMEDLYNYIASN